MTASAFAVRNQTSILRGVRLLERNSNRLSGNQSLSFIREETKWQCNGTKMPMRHLQRLKQTRNPSSLISARRRLEVLVLGWKLSRTQTKKPLPSSIRISCRLRRTSKNTPPIFIASMQPGRLLCSFSTRTASRDLDSKAICQQLNSGLN